MKYFKSNYLRTSRPSVGDEFTRKGKTYVYEEVLKDGQPVYVGRKKIYQWVLKK